MACAVGYALAARSRWTGTDSGTVADRRCKRAQTVENPVLRRLEQVHAQLDAAYRHAKACACAEVWQRHNRPGCGRKDSFPNWMKGSIWLQVQLPPGLSLEKANQMT